jgi:hypothetical protein
VGVKTSNLGDRWFPRIWRCCSKVANALARPGATAEQRIREGKLTLRWTRLSCRAFAHNAVRLQLFALAYNLANFLRSLALPWEIESLTTLREKLVKIGARIVRHGRYLVFQLAEVALRRDPASDRPAARIACAGDMMGGKQVMAAVEGRAMRRSPAEPAATGCRRPVGAFPVGPDAQDCVSAPVMLTDLGRRSIVDAKDGSHLGNLG